MHYTQTAACQLLASRCACCGLSLLDSKSVELAIGPDCRKHYGFDEISTKPDWYAGKTLAANFDPTLDFSTWTDARIACNKLVHHFALDPKGRKWVPECVYALGYIKLSEKMATRPGRIEVRAFPTGDPNPTHFIVKAKYQAGFYPRSFGGTWMPKERTWNVPGESRAKLWDAIQRCFAGRILVTDTGVHEIPAR